ncbi:hypothetical protein EJ110_NYTH33574 [Nymphaea thermarum]|nr:hypothetical protein EJ110_NYTH33574 [Nymphaea thermarum]
MEWKESGASRKATLAESHGTSMNVCSHNGISKKGATLSGGGDYGSRNGAGSSYGSGGTVAELRDIASKIMSFSQLGPRAICILSASGAVSTVTLRQPSTSGGTVTYELLILGLLN